MGKRAVYSNHPLTLNGNQVVELPLIESISFRKKSPSFVPLDDVKVRNPTFLLLHRNKKCN